jgi:hypothetical protein
MQISKQSKSYRQSKIRVKSYVFKNIKKRKKMFRSSLHAFLPLYPKFGKVTAQNIG